MTYDPERHHRRSIRLKGYDYSRAGAYFITIVTRDRAHLFGEVVGGEMRLNEAGRIAEQCWRAIPDHFGHVELDAFVVMPNHVHGIVVLVGATHASPLPDDASPPPDDASPLPDDAPPPPDDASPPPDDAPPPPDDAPPGRPRGPKRQSVASIIGSFKSAVTKRINEWRGTPAAPVWQRNYYEHIIRNEESLNRIRQYITENPARWTFDRDNPLAVTPESEDVWRT